MSNVQETVFECVEENAPPKAGPSPQNKVPPRRSSRKLSSTCVVTQSPDTSQGASTSVDADLLDQEALISRKRKAVLGKAKRSKNIFEVLPRTCNAHSVEATWEERDRQRLLVALQRYGVLNMKELQKAVPGKTEEQIKEFIRSKWRAARMHLREQSKKGKNNGYLGPIDKWLERLNESFPSLNIYKENPLARAILFIWKFETHPDPKDCGGVDFKAAYEYLYYMLRGYPPRELNQPTAAFVSGSLSKFAMNMKCQTWSEERSYIRNTPMQLKCPPKEIKTDEDVLAALSFTEENCLEELLNLPGFNPFDIPMRFLTKKEPGPLNADTPSTSFSNTMRDCDVDSDDSNNG